MANAAFEEWWQKTAGVHADNAVARDAARDAWDAATGVERERCASAVEGFATDQPGIGVSYWGEAIATMLRSGSGRFRVNPPPAPGV